MTISNGCFIIIVCVPLEELPILPFSSSFFFFLAPCAALTLIPNPPKILPNNPAAKVLSTLGWSGMSIPNNLLGSFIYPKDNTNKHQVKINAWATVETKKVIFS